MCLSWTHSWSCSIVWVAQVQQDLLFQCFLYSQVSSAGRACTSSILPPVSYVSWCSLWSIILCRYCTLMEFIMTIKLTLVAITEAFYLYLSTRLHWFSVIISWVILAIVVFWFSCTWQARFSLSTCYTWILHSMNLLSQRFGRSAQQWMYGQLSC